MKTAMIHPAFITYNSCTALEKGPVAIWQGLFLFKFKEGIPMIEEKKPVTVHLAELRRRILFSLAAWLIGSIAAYIYVEEIIAVISAPAGKLYFLNPAEVFFSYLQVAGVTGLFVTLPIHFYELWRFLRPGLRDKEAKAFVWFMPAALVLWYGGAAFSFFVVFPQAVQFFLSFSAVSLQPMFSLAAYLSFFIRLCAAVCHRL